MKISQLLSVGSLLLAAVSLQAAPQTFARSEQGYSRLLVARRPSANQGCTFGDKTYTGFTYNLGDAANAQVNFSSSGLFNGVLSRG